MKKSLLTLALMSAVAAPAYAENMYGSLALGSAASTELTSGSGTQSGTSYSLMFGYEVNKYLAAEVGYTSLLSSASTSGAKLTGNDTSQSRTNTVSGFEIAAAASWPINEQFSVFYRLGYAMMSASASFSGAGTGYTYTGSVPSYNLNGMVYGPGVKYTVTKGMDLRVGYNTYNLPGSYSYSGTSSNGTAFSASNQNGDTIINNIYVSGSYAF